MGKWFVYMVRCADDTLYTGITTDLDRRIGEHNGNGRLGARYTRARRPVKLVYRERLESRALACRREHEIRKLEKSGKEQLVAIFKTDL